MNIFLIFLILLKCLFLVVNSAPTDPRLVHATVIVNNILYVMGGFSNGRSSREFISLDLSQAFDATTPPWKDLTETSPLPILSSWAKASSNTNNDTIFLFGGLMRDTITINYNLKSVVYTYDFKSNQWLVNPPAFQGMAPETRREFASVSDPSTGKLYIHGGTHDLSIPTGVFFNDFFILDGNNFSWSQIGKTGANIPPLRIDHVAVLIANGVIVFIGGLEIVAKELATIVGGPTVDARIGHTAVYAANGQIIVYGGTTPAQYTIPTPELVVLDTTTKPFKWIIPPVTTPEVPINSLTRHQADLIGDYMVPPLKTSNSIQILNTVDYKWVKSFPVLSPTTILAIVVSVGFALIIAAFIGGFLLYHRNRQKKNMQELSSFNDASSSASSTQMMSSHPPPSFSQGQINNNDNFMRSISTKTPSLISPSNSQSSSNRNSVYSLLNSIDNLNNRNNISPLSMPYNDITNPASQTLQMITTPPSTTPTTATNSIYGNDINNNNNFGNFGITPQIHISNTMDPNLQPGLERSTLGLNNIAIDQTHTNMFTTNQKLNRKVEWKYITIVELTKYVVNSAPTDPRFTHTTVIVNNILYVMGGSSNGLPSREFFSLDLLQTFDTITPPWKDLTETSPLPVLITWAKASSNTNNDTIFLFGGIMRDNVTGDYNLKSVVYTHDFKSNQWLVNPPAFQGIAPETRREFASVSDPLSGKLYIHGGGNNVKVPKGVYFNDFFILDGNNLSWSQIGKTGPNMPPIRIDHAAVLIANGVIVFIGGRETITPDAPLTATIVGGPTVDVRTGHTAVYGNITNKAGPPVKTSNSIQILDIVNYKWVKLFPGLSPNNKTSPTTSSNVPPAPSTSSTTILAIVISVGFALIIAVFIGGFLLYGRNRQKKNVQELSSFNDASSSASQINNNDNFMRSISTTTPSLISPSNSQSPSNHNSVYSLLNSNDNLNNRNNISPPSMLYNDLTNPASPTLPMITTPPLSTPTTATNSIYGSDINNNNNSGGFATIITITINVGKLC
ncbi:13323_t:CDS:10 [Entrophospora sp. SA101]|nr:13323_t:CDS:10 [Entrophospora sp. SA101]